MSSGAAPKSFLEPYQWTPVPGTGNTEISPLIRKPCVICSNAYILKCPQWIVVIDPGADPVQIEHIKRVIFDCRLGGHRPVFLFLTHCHTDHYLACDLLTGANVGGRIVCHRLAADAIERRDAGVTLADMNGSILPACRVAVRLFEDPGTGTGPPGGLPLAIEDTSMRTSSGMLIPVQSIAVGRSERIEVLHTPGHSPGGVCYRLGSLLFSSDNHLATTPGIAGKCGWDNQELAHSLTTIVEKGRRDKVSLVLGGHGNALPFERAARIFENARREAAGLSGLAPFNRERSLYISEYAIVLLEEAGIVFGIIAGNLLKIAYYLKMLEENESAGEILKSIDVDAMENIMEDFDTYVRELKGKRGAP